MKPAKRHELDGESLTLREWAERFGVPRQLVAVRVSKGWDLRDALTRPTVLHGGRRVRGAPPDLAREAQIDATLAEERAKRAAVPKAAKVEREPSMSKADLRIERAVRALRAQVVTRAAT